MPELWSPGLTIAPEIVRGRGAPVGPLAIDPNVTAAYQALMQGIAQGDLNKSYYQGQLTTNLARSKDERAKQQLLAQQNLSDRGMLNSGAALGKQADINTQYDQYDSDVTNQINNLLTGIETNITGLQTGYENEQIAGSGRWTAEQARIADEAVRRQQAQDDNEAEMQRLISALAPVPAPEPYIPPAPAYTPPRAYAPVAAPKPKPAYVAPISGQTGQLKQQRVGGPQ
jgi:hypothetical protein